MRVLITGASGFVGRRLTTALEGAGHEVRAMTRHPERYSGAGTAVAGDIADEDSLHAACEGCAAAYYLVHSLEDKDFAEEDARGARAFSRAASDAGVQRIVYLGGLGDERDDLSPHLRSRRELERLLAGTGVPVTTLRAGIVVGHGGVSWELTRQLVERLPVMVTPRWAETRTQPIAIVDMVRYLVGVLELPEAEGRSLDVGGADVLRYVDMLTRVAAIEKRRLVVLPVPFLSASLSSHWLRVITDVDRRTALNLIESMDNEVVVRDDSIRRIVPFEPMGYDAMVRAALRERAEAESA